MEREVPLPHLCHQFLEGRTVKVLAAPAIITKLNHMAFRQFRRSADESILQISLVCYAVGFQLSTLLQIRIFRGQSDVFGGSIHACAAHPSAPSS